MHVSIAPPIIRPTSQIEMESAGSCLKKGVKISKKLFVCFRNTVFRAIFCSNVLDSNVALFYDRSASYWSAPNVSAHRWVLHHIPSVIKMMKAILLVSAVVVSVALKAPTTISNSLAKVVFSPLPKVYVYDHCPFCGEWSTKRKDDLIFSQIYRQTFFWWTRENVDRKIRVACDCLSTLLESI